MNQRNHCKSRFYDFHRLQTNIDHLFKRKIHYYTHLTKRLFDVSSSNIESCVLFRVSKLKTQILI